jgi:hypothetical protein
MNKRFYVYSIFLAIVYIVFLGHSVYEMGEFGVAGFKLGMNGGKERKPVLVCGGFIAPVAGNATFPTNFLNEKTGEEGHLEIRSILAYVSKAPDAIPVYVSVLELFNPFLSFVLGFLFLVLPFFVYRILKSISKEEFYSSKNINNIRYVSFMLLTIFFVKVIAGLIIVIRTNAIMQLKDYKAYFGEINYALLLMGLIILILSEILKYTTSMKEEADLTI